MSQRHIFGSVQGFALWDITESRSASPLRVVSPFPISPSSSSSSSSFSPCVISHSNRYDSDGFLPGIELSDRIPLHPKGEPKILAEIFANRALAQRVALLCQERSYRQTCKRIAVRFRRRGIQSLAELNDSNLKVWAASFTATDDRTWLCIIFFNHDPNGDGVSKYFNACQPCNLLLVLADNVFFNDTTQQRVGEAKLRELRRLLNCVKQLLRNRSDSDELVRRCHALDTRVESSLQLSQRRQTHAPQTPPRLLVGSPASSEPSLHSASRYSDFCVSKRPVFALSVWDLDSPEMRPKTEVFDSDNFAKEVSIASNAQSYRHVCWDVIKRFKRDGEQRRILDKYVVYARVMNKDTQNLCCIAVYHDSVSLRQVAILPHFNFLEDAVASMVQTTKSNTRRKLENLLNATGMLSSFAEEKSDEPSRAMRLQNEVLGLMSQRQRRELGFQNFVHDNVLRYEERAKAQPRFVSPSRRTQMRVQARLLPQRQAVPQGNTYYPIQFLLQLCQEMVHLVVSLRCCRQLKESILRCLKDILRTIVHFDDGYNQLLAALNSQASRRQDKDM